MGETRVAAVTGASLCGEVLPGITDNGRLPPSYREQFGVPREQHPARVV